MSFEVFKPEKKTRPKYGAIKEECTEMLKQLVAVDGHAKTDISPANIHAAAKDLGIKVYVSKLSENQYIVWVARPAKEQS